MQSLTLSSWRSHLGIVAVNLSLQEYPRVRINHRVINKSARFVSRGFRPESDQSILSSWRSRLGIVAVGISHQKTSRTVGDLFTA